MVTNGNEKHHNGPRSFSLLFNKLMPKIEIVIVTKDGRIGQQTRRKLISYGKWSIEGDFIITYSPTARRVAHKIPSDTKMIYERGTGNAPR